MRQTSKCHKHDSNIDAGYQTQHNYNKLAAIIINFCRTVTLPILFIFVQIVVAKNRKVWISQLLNSQYFWLNCCSYVMTKLLIKEAGYDIGFK